MTDEAKCEVCLDDHPAKDCLGFINFRLLLFQSAPYALRVDTVRGIYRQTPLNMYRFRLVRPEGIFVPGVEKCIFGMLKHAHSLGPMKRRKSYIEYEGLDYFADYLYNRMSLRKIEDLFRLYKMDQLQGAQQ